MKKSIAFVLFLLILVALTPWVVGAYYKKQFLAILNAKQQPQDIQVTLEEYKLGWLSSKAKVRITIMEPEQSGMSNIDIFIESVITHGPVVFDKASQHLVLAQAAMETSIEYPQKLLAFIKTTNPNAKMVTIDSLIQLNNNSQNHIKSEPINIDLPIGLNITWEGMDGFYDVVMVKNIAHAINSHGTFGAITINASVPNQPQAQLQLQPLTWKYASKLHPVGIWVAGGSSSMSKMNFSMAGANVVTIDNITTSAESDITNNNTSCNLTYQLQLGRVVAPSLPITEVNHTDISFRINNLNVNGINALSEYTNNNPRVSHDDQKQLEEVKPLLRQILAGATLSSNANITTTLGALNVNASISNTDTFVNEAMKEKLNTDEIKAELDVKIAAPLAVNLVEIFLEKSAPKISARASGGDPQLDPATPNTASNKMSSEMFNEEVAKMMKAGKLSLPTSMEIMTLQSQNLTPDAFSASLGKFKLPPDVMNHLNDLYAQTSGHKQAVAAAQQQSPAEQAKVMIEGWIKQGYLIRDQNNFLMKITKDNHQVMINGVPIEQNAGLTQQPTTAEVSN